MSDHFELAAHLCGYTGPDPDDIGEVWAALSAKYGIGKSDFNALIDALLPLIDYGNEAFTVEVAKGFAANKSSWLSRVKSKNS